MNSEYEVENDDYYKAYMSKPERNESTGKRYKTILRKVYKSTGYNVGEIIEKCLDEQSIVTRETLAPDENGNERYREIKFNVNNKDNTVNKVFNKYEEYCVQRKNKKVSIQAETDSLRAFLSEFGVILPKRKNYEDDAEEWYLPTKDDFNFITQDLSLVHQALLNFLISTGMRVSDATSITIGQYMEATSEYHDFVDVEEFIDNAPDDMIGQWEFVPKKAKRKKTQCITFNSTESNNLILQHLRHVKNHYIPFKNNRDKINLKINKKYPLFGSRSHRYKKEITPKSVGGEWSRKNKKFREWKIQQIKQKIENGELSAEDYDDEVSKIPKFHPHICRKFFSTTVSNNCGDIRVCARLEGHSDGLPNDKFYIKKSVEDIKEIYVNNIHDELCLSNIETKIVTNKKTEELNKKVAESDAKIEALTNENAKLKQQLNKTQEQIAETNKVVEELTLKRKRSDIRKIITNHFYDNYRDRILQKEYDKDGEQSIGLKKCVVICEIAYEMALENESSFTETTEYLDSLIKKAIVTCSFNPDMIVPKYEKIHAKNSHFNEINMTMSNIIADVIVIIGNHEEVWDMVKEDQKTLKNTIVNHIQNSNYDLDNITLKDKQNMAETVIMEYLTAV
ncbi:MAG: tyrosine-type recombinase/integrase [Methanobrevibacter sp.]|nr:tyrosine-type recombinase/integrase [Methanobrevibacter sp.]